MDLEKEYLACVRFGQETDTLDPEGIVIARGDVPSLKTIESVLPGFEGEIEQVPPVFSALHYKGRRAHVLARSGREVKLDARKIRIYAIDIVDFRDPVLTIRVVCSKGTYIRALARDMARRCGSCARLESLTRTRIGSFKREDAVKPEDFDSGRDLLPPSLFADKIDGLGAKVVKPERIGEIAHGVPLDDEVFVSPPAEDGAFALYGGERDLLAIAMKTGARYRYVAVLSEP
jgi:tRNA pseudouridine55 synthase